jgi:hypothetical protein
MTVDLSDIPRYRATRSVECVVPVSAAAEDTRRFDVGIGECEDVSGFGWI